MNKFAMMKTNYFACQSMNAKKKMGPYWEELETLELGKINNLYLID